MSVPLGGAKALPCRPLAVATAALLQLPAPAMQTWSGTHGHTWRNSTSFCQQTTLQRWDILQHNQSARRSWFCNRGQLSCNTKPAWALTILEANCRSRRCNQRATGLSPARIHGRISDSTNSSSQLTTAMGAQHSRPRNHTPLIMVSLGIPGQTSRNTNAAGSWSKMCSMWQSRRCNQRARTASLAGLSLTRPPAHYVQHLERAWQQPAASTAVTMPRQSSSLPALLRVPQAGSRAGSPAA
mmetsp:Transcript_23688/g.73793  ORF Transcript_23688/g.73793 Transcript_23688/m.73793 type:complete len:241 (-) Transcript_23688:38-760(-)